MKASLLFTIAAIYGAILGVVLLVDPNIFFAGIYGANGVPATVIGIARGCGAILIGVASINWFARNAEPSQARDSIQLGMLIGFIALTITGILRVMSAPPTTGGLVTLVLNTLLAIAFSILVRANMATTKK